ncbi:MAG: hypothetical protein CMJ78_27410 [Planctomycetaceae bacterium]|nr:hypothetical protein [Planctomycetaceae bacterium]
MMSEFIKNTPERSQRTNQWLAVALPFVIPISTSLTEIIIGAILVCWLFSGQFKNTFGQLRSNRIAQLSIGLFALLAISSIWSTADTALIGKFLAKYRMLLYVPIYFVVFERSDLKRQCQWGFYAAMTLTLVCSYINFYTNINIGRDDPLAATVFRDRITQNILLSLFVYSLSVEFFESSRHRWLMAVLIAAGLFNVIGMASGRTGYLLVASLACLFALQHFRWRGLAFAGACLVSIGAVTYFVSPAFQLRIDETVAGIQRFQSSDKDPRGQYRLRIYAQGVQTLLSNPVIGTGVGSWGTELARHIPKDSPFYFDDPHNEYLAIGIQTGGMGLGVFGALLLMLWKRTAAMSSMDRKLACGCLVTLCVGSLVNSLLMSFSLGHLFAYWAAYWYAPGIQDEEELGGSQSVSVESELRQAA